MGNDVDFEELVTRLETSYSWKLDPEGLKTIIEEAEIPGNPPLATVNKILLDVSTVMMLAPTLAVLLRGML